MHPLVVYDFLESDFCPNFGNFEEMSFQYRNYLSQQADRPRANPTALKQGSRLGLGENNAYGGRYNMFAAKPTAKPLGQRVDMHTHIEEPKKPAVQEAKPSSVLAALNSNEVEDVDIADHGNPLAVPVFVKEIYAYLREQEKSDVYRVPVDFISRQSSIEPKMRAAMIDWMVDIHHRFKLANESIFLAANIFDRFLAKKVVAKDRLQLVGVTSLWLASKIEESYTPSVRSFARTVTGIDKKDMFSMERLILKVTEFNLNNPTSITFLRRFAKVADMTTRDRYLAFYLAELANQECTMVQFLPSQVAAGCVMLAHKIVRQTPWTPTLAAYSGYTEEQLTPVVNELKGVVNRVPTSGLKGVFRKYSDERYQRVAKLISYQ